MRKKGWKLPLMFLLLFGLLFFLSDQTALAFGARNVKWELAGSALLAGLLTISRLRKRRAYAGVEHGSARYGTKKDIKPLIHPEFSQNILLSDTERLSMDMRATRLNCHVLVVGGSGSGKSRYYVKPNVMQRNASYVITDPSGEHLRDEGKMLQDAEYDVRVFDTVHLKGHFNPFAYFHTPKDIRRFIETLMANTSGDQTNPQHAEDFWVKSERLWLMAHIAYLMETCEPEEFNIPSMTRLLNASEAREDDEDFQSAVDILFQELEEEHPESFAVKQYKKYKLAAGVICSKQLLNHGFSHGY